MNSLVIRFAWAVGWGGGGGWEGLVVEGNLVCCLITVVIFIRLGKTEILSEIFEGRKFRGSQKPRKFCIFVELNFAVE